ncbi:hypothetical protein PV328_000985 [Microctonus aethiopoides]|uniref:Uncharacterized protein n=1 Tax=Microctonus aethiopoides TaxID=144406 RepID=A0AA39FW06_9HYME|nr:hypothetical protein PV328_000985 [Microctonus aethiopoides]
MLSLENLIAEQDLPCSKITVTQRIFAVRRWTYLNRFESKVFIPYFSYHEPIVSFLDYDGHEENQSEIQTKTKKIKQIDLDTDIDDESSNLNDSTFLNEVEISPRILSQTIQRIRQNEVETSTDSEKSSTGTS